MVLEQKYFNDDIADQIESLDGGDLEYNTDYSIGLEEDYKMIGEEKQPIKSIESTKPIIDTKDEVPTNSKLVESSGSKNDNTTSLILDSLKSLDSKIEELENLLQEDNKAKTSTKNNILQGDYKSDSSFDISTVSLVDKNFFSEDNIDKNYSNLNENNVENRNLNNNFNESNINSNKTDKNYSSKIISDIKQLRTEKENLLNQLYFKEESVAKNDIINNENNNSSVLLDNFTPDIFSIENNEALENSIKTENIYGKDPVIVKDREGTPAVISENQINLKNAIQEHGGIEEAIKDSVQQQSFVLNLGKERSIPNIFENQENIFNDSLVEGNENEYKEINSDNNLDVVKNTKNTVAAINNLSKQFNNLAKAITNGFNSINGNIREINYNQMSVSRSSNNMQVSQGSNQSFDRRSSENGYISSEIRGNEPIKDHFPKDFNFTELGGSNLNRI